MPAFSDNDGNTTIRTARAMWLRYGAVLVAIGVVASLLTSSTGAQSGDPLRPQQWGHVQLHLDEAYDTSTGDGVVIAILDSGVDLDHPDLVDKLVPGWDFIENDDQPQDENGHGTHVAGIAAAATNNGIGIAGAAPDARIMPVRVMNALGVGDPEVISQAITWAADHGADIINLSLGGSTDLLSRIFKSGPMNAAIVDANSKGVLVVAAAGNDDTFIQAYRDDVPVLVVNATNEAGLPAQFSNWGDPRAVAAPGTRILSTAPTEPTWIWKSGTDGYEELNGTSMAAPYVAGVAALLVATHRGDDPNTIRQILLDTSENPSGDPRLGAGIVNAEAAVVRSDRNLWLIALAGTGIIIGIVALAWHYLLRPRRRARRTMVQSEA
ncbi:MAG TPA: S8 family serine peptidase [Thermomicrobiales bacterium]|nr:S8 family serine peptidase [Thermomicrobiales bacterium]